MISPLIAVPVLISTFMSIPPPLHIDLPVGVKHPPNDSGEVAIIAGGCFTQRALLSATHISGLNGCEKGSYFRPRHFVKGHPGSHRLRGTVSHSAGPAQRSFCSSHSPSPTALADLQSRSSRPFLGAQRRSASANQPLVVDHRLTRVSAFHARVSAASAAPPHRSTTGFPSRIT